MTETTHPPTREPLVGWFGLTPPETAVAAWGARAISARNTLDLVWNRQQCDPTCGGGGVPALHAELHNYFLPLIRQRLAHLDPALRGTSAELT